MKKKDLIQQGYRKIDQVAAMWRHSYTNMNGENVIFADYAYYDIYYNTIKDHYEMIARGFQPLQHYMNDELSIALNFINSKPKIKYMKFTHTSNDYFIQKESIMNAIGPEIQETVQTEGELDMVILRFPLEAGNTSVMKLRDSNPKLVNIINEFKEKGLSENVEIYEELDNIIVTTEGYFVCTYKENIRSLKKDEGQD